MDGVHVREASSRLWIKVEEVDPNVVSDVEVVRVPYKVDEMIDGVDDEEVNACRDVIETASFADEEQATEENQTAKTNLILLLMQHLEFAPAIKDTVRNCREAGFSLDATYVLAKQVVDELRAHRKKDGMLRIVGGVAAGAVSGVVTGLLCGGPVGAAVGAVIGIGSHFTPWGVFRIFRQVDRDVEVELQGLFGD
jgi:uncharacterized membrane protein